MLARCRVRSALAGAAVTAALVGFADPLVLELFILPCVRIEDHAVCLLPSWVVMTWRVGAGSRMAIWNLIASMGRSCPSALHLPTA